MDKFAGFIDFEAHRRQEKERLQMLTLMGKQLSCRHSDARQYFAKGDLSLVCRRLSTAGSKDEQQLIGNKDQTRFCLLDGRMYNPLQVRSQLQAQHEFRTDSEAEIILYLYEQFGPESLNHLST